MRGIGWILGVIFLCAALTCSSQAAAQEPELITNGDFESGPRIGPDHYRIEPGSREITGWKVIRGSVDYVGSAWISPNGTHCLDLEGNAAFGGVSQTIPTTPGQVYTVTFDLAGNVDGDPQVKKMRVQAAGQSTERWFNIEGRDPENLGWETHTWQFLATRDETTVEFVSDGDGPGHRGALLDNVSVNAAQPWGVRKRVVRPPSKDAISVEGDLRLDTSIPVTLNAGAGDTPDVVRIGSVKFVPDDGFLQAQVSAKELSSPRGRWRLVVELLDESKRVTRRRDAYIENSGIILGRAMMEERVITIDLGAWEERALNWRPTAFRLSIESAPPHTGEWRDLSL